MQAAGVVDVDRGRGDLEYLVAVFEAQDVLVGPVTKAAVFRQAVAPDARAGENHVVVGGTHLDGLDDLDEVHAVAFGKDAPLIQKGQEGRPERVFHDLAGFAFDGPVQHRQGEFFDIQDIREEPGHPLPGRIVHPAADPPEIADGGHVLPAGHDPFKGMSQQGLGGIKAAPFKGFLDDGIGDVFRGAGGDRRFDQDHAFRLNPVADDPQALFQRGDLRMTGTDISQVLLEVITLHVHDNHIGKGKGLFREGGDQGLLLCDTTADERDNLRVLRLDRGDSPVEQGDLPERPHRWPLHADHELVRLARRFVDGIGHDAGHDRSDKTETHHNDDFPTQVALRLDHLFQSLKFPGIIFRQRQGKDFATRADRLQSFFRAHKPSFPQ
ncbi:MAG: hypothetical protein A4E72_00913 [Syntrophus sp. PtaU1.Bin208]|nr:MAG: hypothetical protein A4E72_00913 [Syntrophus sp. PtaU1.Bin208]